MANTEKSVDKPVDKPVDKVIGLSGEPVNMPGGRWLAQVDENGNLVEQDGHLVRVRD